MLGQPVDLQAGTQPAQFPGDGHIPAGVAQPDGGGDVQHPLRAAAPPARGPRPGRVRPGCLQAGAGRFRLMPSRLNQLAEEEVDFDRVAGMG